MAISPGRVLVARLVSVVVVFTLAHALRDTSRFQYRTSGLNAVVGELALFCLAQVETEEAFEYVERLPAGNWQPGFAAEAAPTLLV